MNIKPLGNKIVIEVDTIPEEIKTESGIILKDFGNIKQASVQTGKVIAVGPGVKNTEGVYIKSFLKPGDRIVFNHHALFKCDIIDQDGVTKNFLYIAEHDIVAVLED